MAHWPHGKGMPWWRRPWGGCAHASHSPGPPVYWPWKETLSGRLETLVPLVLSGAVWGLSSEVLIFPDGSCGESGSHSEPRVETEGLQSGWSGGHTAQGISHGRFWL